MPAAGVELYQEAVALHQSNQLVQAEQRYRAFLKDHPAHADCLHQLGALLVQRDGKAQCDEAQRLVKAAIQLAPANARYRRSLGVVLEAAQQYELAADAYQRAVEKRPNDVQTHLDLARVLKAADRHARAADAYKAALLLQPDHPSAHYKLASVLKQLGKHQAAAHHYREQLRLDPTNSLAAFWLAAVEPAAAAAAPVAACPSSLVAKLFDGYAENFDSHLVHKLRYQTPEMLMDCVWQAAAAAAGTDCSALQRSSSSSSSPVWRRCADLGCGTGLMGPLLRPHCSQLCGVDLSAGMVAKAQQRGCYDELAVAELGQYLQEAQAGGGAGFDLLVAADVFVYIGELLPVLQPAAAAAADRALFAFSTEMLPTTSGTPNSSSSSSSGDRDGLDQAVAAAQATAGVSAAEAGYMLQATGRYAHSAGYLRQAAAASGWQLVLIKESVTIRYNAGQPILGNLCVLQRCT